MTSSNKKAELSPEFLEAAKIILAPLFPILKGVVEFWESDSNLTAPRTRQHNFEKKIEQFLMDIFKDVPQERFKQSILTLLREAFLNLPDHMQQATQRIRTKFHTQFSDLSAYHSLDALTKAAEGVSVQQCGDAFRLLDLNSCGRRFLLASSLIHQAESCEGEARAEATMHATKRISESLYQPYVRMLHRLFNIAANRPIDRTSKKTYGQIFQELSIPLFIDQYPDLLDINAVLFRNAEAHESWDYLPESDEVEAWDRKAPKTRIRVTELFKRASDMAMLSGAMLPEYIKVRIFSNMEEMLNKGRGVWPELIHTDSTIRNAAWLNLQQKKLT